MVKKWSDKVPQRNARGNAPQQEAGLETIVLVTGTDMEGNPQWAYAEIPADRFVAFKQAEAQGNYQLQEFGTILACGPGEAPPESVQQEMAENYGCDMHFEEDMEEMFGDMLIQLSEMIDKFSSYMAENEESSAEQEDDSQEEPRH